MQAIITAICLIITFVVGYSSGKAVTERDELKLAQQYHAKADLAEQTLTNEVAQLEAKHESAITAMRARYDSVRHPTKTIYVSKPATCAKHSEQAADSDGLSEGVGGIEIGESAILNLMQAADEQTQSLMACQAYVGIIHSRCK